MPLVQLKLSVVAFSVVPADVGERVHHKEEANVADDVDDTRNNEKSGETIDETAPAFDRSLMLLEVDDDLRLVGNLRDASSGVCWLDLLNLNGS